MQSAIIELEVAVIKEYIRMLKSVLPLDLVGILDHRFDLGGPEIKELA